MEGKKVLNTYIVSNNKYSQKDVVFECENNWYLQTVVLQDAWETVVTEITEEKARELIK